MKNIKIVNYEHKYAAATAVMWQNSKQGWNGDSFFTSEQAVITEEENSIHLNAWLALDGDLVVGYCNLYEYQHDTGALYIGLLSVRDDYHGKKIGKALVLKAINRTIELGWERLDLYTWPGNTKAVPLYKKTGFFWEDRDDSTHLVNLIPCVLNIDLLKEHFKEIDWYEDSIRDLEVKPDGKKENEFDYLTYEWQKGSKHLLAEFCRRGRGLRKIETDDFSITVTVENLKLVFGNKYKIKYEIVNQTKSPLNIKIKGVSEKNITFDFAKEFLVKDTEIIEAEFYVGVIEKEQNSFKTHPNVFSEISVNGKSATFKVGIEPKFPAKISLSHPAGMRYKDIETKMFINIENYFKEPATFSFELPSTDCVNFTKQKHEIALKSLEKASIPITYLLKKGCFYSQDVAVKVKKDSSEFVFNRKMESIFQTYSDNFYGKGLNHHLISNGKYMLYFRHKEFINGAYFVDTNSSARIFFQYPKLGKPFSDEFNKHLYDKVEYSYEGSVSRFTIFYSSEQYKGLKFRNHFELQANGILKNWFEFEYCSNEKCTKNIKMKYSVGVPFGNSVMHYNGNLIETKKDVSNGAENWNWEKISEPWIFTKCDNSTISCIWDADNPLKLGDWEKFFEFDLGRMKAGEHIETKPVTFAFDTFQTYTELRNYTQKQLLKKQPLKESFHFELNNGNPFVDGEIPIRIQENKQKKLNGKISITSQNNLFEPVNGEFIENNLMALNAHLLSSKIGIDVAEMSAELKNLKFQRKRVYFPIGKRKVEYSQNGDTHEINNGVLTLKVSDKFGPVLYSMQYKGSEWLDSSYPNPTAKSWWKPWLGGIMCAPSQVQTKSLLEEKYIVKFVTKIDTLGNKWSGMCIEIEFVENEKSKGLNIKQYFLLLPKVPVMFSILEIKQNTGKYMPDQYVQNHCFLKPDDKIENSSVLLKGKDCEDIEIFGGDKSHDRQTTQSAIFKGKNRKEILQIKSFSDYKNIYLMLDTNVIAAWCGDMIRAKNRETVFVNPHCYIFNEQEIDDKLLVDLANVKFES
jgi:ribosomal protein S18 acetylase RimI-like enzyme